MYSITTRFPRASSVNALNCQTQVHRSGWPMEPPNFEASQLVVGLPCPAFQSLVQNLRHSMRCWQLDQVKIPGLVRSSKGVRQRVLRTYPKLGYQLQHETTYSRTELLSVTRRSEDLHLRLDLSGCTESAVAELFASGSQQPWTAVKTLTVQVSDSTWCRACGKSMIMASETGLC